MKAEKDDRDDGAKQMSVLYESTKKEVHKTVFPSVVAFHAFSMFLTCLFLLCVCVIIVC